MVHVCNPSTQEAEIGELRVSGYPGLQNDTLRKEERKKGKEGGRGKKKERKRKERKEKAFWKNWSCFRKFS